MKYEKILSKIPTLTVGIPTLNEEKYIGTILDTFLSSNYKGLIEILVCDGGSTDRTVEIILEYAKRDSRVKHVHNPNKKQVYAFNQMIELAKGELLMIAGAHAYYEKDYIQKCIQLHLKTDALNVGGPTRITSETTTQLGILIAWYSFLGNGGAKHRNPNYTGYTETLFPGCYYTKALKAVGGFNTENITNQDTEVNLRISQLKEDAHYVDSNIYVYYYPRDSFISLIKQYFRYGRGRFLTSFKHFPKIPLRGYISFLFLLINAAIFLLIPITFFSVYFVILLLVAWFDSFFTLKKRLLNEKIWSNENSAYSKYSALFYSTISLLLMHVSMGVGFLFQLVKFSTFGLWKLKW